MKGIFLNLFCFVFIIQVCGNEFLIKRETNFKFKKVPTVQKASEGYTIEFETESACDVTICIEDGEQKILRHLASGVLGVNAPFPFQANTLKQKIEWDGKDDGGQYIKTGGDIFVRVSLGLKPKFERSLFWDPKKALDYQATQAHIVCAKEEGVYVYQSGIYDSLKLFDHGGEYIRTIYPFENKDIKNIKGLRTHNFPHSNEELPLKTGYYQCTLLHHASDRLKVTRRTMSFGASSLSIHNGQIALVGPSIARLNINPEKSNLDINGSKTGVEIGIGVYKKEYTAQPWSSAFSPDGQWLYMSAFAWRFFHQPATDAGSLNAVMRIKYNTNEKPEIFLGDLEKGKKEKTEFNTIGGIAIDKNGRILIADHFNNRVVVYSENKEKLKEFKVDRPAQICIHEKTNEIYVFTLPINNTLMGKNNGNVIPKVTLFEPFEKDFKQIKNYDLPLEKHSGIFGNGSPGFWYRAELNSWSKSPEIWLSRVHAPGHRKLSWDKSNILIVKLEKSNAKVIKDFGEDQRNSKIRTEPAAWSRQRLYANPANGNVYIGEGDSGTGKSFHTLIEINPSNGSINEIEMPFDAEDICFDHLGNIYLRTGKYVVRYDFKTWREVPWDYGEEREGVTFSDKKANVISALSIPGVRTNPFWHLGGMAVNVKGHLAIHTFNDPADISIKYKPQNFPGRMVKRVIHIYDKHGKVLKQDVVPGIGHINGLQIDRDDKIYLMASARRLLKGASYDPKLDDDVSETLIKFNTEAAKVLSDGATFVPIPLLEENKPKRDADIVGTAAQACSGKGWVEGAEWFYGGIGFAGMLASWDSGGCCCWNARFELDYLGRSFVPELRHYSIGILDTNGNVMTRVGKYGNIEDGQPLIEHKGIKSNSIGGDEVALFHAPFVATHTDHRLFIADPGNGRILSVLLNYSAEKKVKIESKSE